MTATAFYQMAPEIALLVFAALILMVDLASSSRRVGVYSILAGVGTLVSASLVIPLIRNASSHNISGMVTADALSIFMIPIFTSAALLAVIFSVKSREVVPERHAEYHAILLIFTAGLCLVASATNILMLYVALEVISISAYALTAFNPNHERSVEAGLKYAIFGGVASGIMLFGMSLLYGMTGGLGYEAIKEGVLAIQKAGQNTPHALLMYISVLFIMAGFAYKLAAVPFHAWCPDAYEGAPTSFTAMMSVAPKAAGLAAMLRFFLSVFGESGAGGTFVPSDIVPWQAVVGVISVATMTFGNLGAITQTNLKRLLAYSSIAHAGYMLMGLVALSRGGITAIMAYLVIYLIMNMGAFFAILIVAEFTDSESIDDFAGMSKRLPILAASMAVFLLSLTGLPPFAGFIGKFYLFAAVLQREGTWYFILAIIGVLNSVISLYYYARVLRAMYLEEPKPGSVEMQVNFSRNAILVALAFITIALGLYWDPLAAVASRVSYFI